MSVVGESDPTILSLRRKWRASRGFQRWNQRMPGEAPGAAARLVSTLGSNQSIL